MGVLQMSGLRGFRVLVFSQGSPKVLRRFSEGSPKPARRSVVSRAASVPRA